jgi:soluble lytic murein transglycosylase-like protein
MGLMAARLGAIASSEAWTLASTWGPRYGVDPALVMAVMQVESGLDPSARGSAGEGGLMQLLPSTAALLAGRPVSADELIANPDLSVQLGTQYLGQQIARYGVISDGVAAYNAGSARKNSAEQYVNSQGRTNVDVYVTRVMDAYAQLAGGGGGADVSGTVTATVESAPAWWQNPWMLAAGALVAVAGLVIITD